MKKNDKRNGRNPSISVSVTPQLFQQIAVTAKEDGRSVACWMRRLAEVALAAPAGACPATQTVSTNAEDEMT